MNVRHLLERTPAPLAPRSPVKQTGWAAARWPA